MEIKKVYDSEELIKAFEKGVDDGLLNGEFVPVYEPATEAARLAYKRGYDHGVWLYCELLKEDGNDMKPLRLDEEAIHMACAHFDRVGGSFNRTLATLWRIADRENKNILRQAFADLFMQGYTQALEWAQREKEI